MICTLLGYTKEAYSKEPGSRLKDNTQPFSFGWLYLGLTCAILGHCIPWVREGEMIELKASFHSTQDLFLENQNYSCPHTAPNSH